MKKILLFCVISLLVTSVSAINLVIDYATFYSIGNQPYVEFYLSVNGNSLAYEKTENDQYQAKIEVLYLIEKGDSIIEYQKFQLNTPFYELADSKLDLIDLKRIPLKNGNYTFSFIVKDLVSEKVVESTQKLRPIATSSEELTISEILLGNQILKSDEEDGVFYKSGYEVIPNFSHTYGVEKNELSFYAEIYNAKKVIGDHKAYLLEYAIVEEGQETVIANLRSVKRKQAEEITPILFTFNLDNLPSGNYHLVVKVKDRENKLLASRKVSFLRSNPGLVNYSSIEAKNTFVDSLTNKEHLQEYIKSLRPISTYAELQFAENQLAYADLGFMQQFFLNFWKTRNPTDPESEWKEYMDKVQLVDEKFGYGNIKGYTTERGRIYLQYGPPDAVQNVPYEPETYPYSIWQYYKLQGLTDRKFVFYSPSMEMLGYEILHSNVRGEINNPGWEAQLISGSNMLRRSNWEDPGNTIINDRARDLFNNPR